MCAATSMAAAQQAQTTPYELIRPVFPLTWDSTVFKDFDTTVAIIHQILPKKLTPPEYEPNAIVPDSLNQAYFDAMNVRISRIRVNQAGYLESDPERQFYYVGDKTTFEVVDINGKSFSPAITGTLRSSKRPRNGQFLPVQTLRQVINSAIRLLHTVLPAQS